ncbi:tetratricopeptide repeat protein [Thermodesulfobacteriota bacterium]
MKVLKTILFVSILSLLFLFPSLSLATCEEGKDIISKAESASDLDGKIEYYTEALSKCPDNIEVLTTMTDLYLENNYYDAAYGVVYRLLSLNKFSAEGYYKLAYIYMMWEEYDQAEKAAQKALDINSYYVDNYLLLGDLRYYTRDYKEAMKFYKKALDIDPNNAQAYKKIASLFFLFEKYDKVVVYLDKAVAVDKNEDTIKLKELIIKNNSNDYAAVKKLANEILSTDPNNLMALQTLSIAMLEHEKEKSHCIEVLTKVYSLERQPFMKNKVEKQIEQIMNSIVRR